MNLRQDRQVVQVMKKKRKITAQQIKDDVDLAVSPQTIRNILRRAGYQSYKTASKPFISEVNRKKRIAWAKKHVKWSLDDWKDVLFSDESPFVLRFAFLRIM
jgi:hypothetical protein